VTLVHRSGNEPDDVAVFCVPGVRLNRTSATMRRPNCQMNFLVNDIRTTASFSAASGY
jgi:hypothetical protein